MIGRILCRLGLHAWTPWEPYFWVNGGDNPPMTVGHYLYDTRGCKRGCGASQQGEKHTNPSLAYAERYRRLREIHYETHYDVVCMDAGRRA